MAYVMPNFKSKTELKDALAAGKEIEVSSPAWELCPLTGALHLKGHTIPSRTNGMRKQ